MRFLLDLLQPHHVDSINLIGKILQLPIKNLHEGARSLWQGTHGGAPGNTEGRLCNMCKQWHFEG